MGTCFKQYAIVKGVDYILGFFFSIMNFLTVATYGIIVQKIVKVELVVVVGYKSCIIFHWWNNMYYGALRYSLSCMLSHSTVAVVKSSNIAGETEEDSNGQRTKFQHWFYYGMLKILTDVFHVVTDTASLQT